MSALPTSPRLLLGPGPSPVSPRVLAALAAPPRSHLDPEMLALLDDIRARLARIFRAPDDHLTLALSGTGTSGMEAAVHRVAGPGRSALAVVNGYFGDRLAQILARHGAEVRLVNGDWGRAIDPAAVEAGLKTGPSGRPFDIVAVVHGETSTGVANPVAEIARLAKAHGAITIVDAVTTMGAVPVDVAGWGVDICYSCSQKGLGAPSGLAPITCSKAMAVRAARSFYLDLDLISDFWIGRKYHHTISAPLVYALGEALAEVEEEGIEARWQRHEDVHAAFIAGLERLGLGLLPPSAERLMSLNAVRVPEGVDEAAVRKQLLAEDGIEIGAGLGPLAGKVWRIGLMGSGATAANVQRLLGALARILQKGQ